MKKLLHLYNYGHNPFPKLGRGGLGYHLPQYKLKGRGVEYDSETGIYNWDGDDEYTNFLKDGYIVGKYTLLDDGEIEIKEDDNPEPYKVERLENRSYFMEPYKINEGDYYDEDDEEDNLHMMRRQYKIDKNMKKYSDIINLVNDEGLSPNERLKQYYKGTKKTRVEDRRKSVLNKILEGDEDVIKKITDYKKVLDEEQNKKDEKESKRTARKLQNQKEDEERREKYKVYHEITNEFTNRYDDKTDAKSYLTRIKAYLFEQKDDNELNRELYDQYRELFKNIDTYKINTIDKLKDYLESLPKNKVQDLIIDSIDDIQEVIKNQKPLTPEEIKERQEAREIYNEIKSHEGNFDNLGTAYEDYLVTKKQDFLKDITESTTNFQDSSKNPKFYINGKPIMVKSDRGWEPLHIVAPIALDNDDTALEVKNNFDKDHIQIQGTKLYPMPYRAPLFNKVGDEWRLYNIWNKQLNNNEGDWQYDKFNKKYNVLGLINSGQYLYNVTENFEDYTYNESNIKDKNGKIIKGINGEQLYTIDPSYLHNILPYSERGNGKTWYKINKGLKGLKKI